MQCLRKKKIYIYKVSKVLKPLTHFKDGKIKIWYEDDFGKRLIIDYYGNSNSSEELWKKYHKLGF